MVTVEANSCQNRLTVLDPILSTTIQLWFSSIWYRVRQKPGVVGLARGGSNR